jgi:hypothetical protein
MARIALGILAVALGAAGVAPDAQAFQGFRCGSGRLIEEGDRPPEVLNRCGDPDFADSHEEQRTVRRTVWTYVQGVPIAKEEEVIVSVLVEEWTYDLGPNRFIRHLIFEQNRLIRVFNTGERGAKN